MTPESARLRDVAAGPAGALVAPSSRLASTVMLAGPGARRVAAAALLGVLLASPAAAPGVRAEPTELNMAADSDDRQRPRRSVIDAGSDARGDARGDTGGKAAIPLRHRGALAAAGEGGEEEATGASYPPEHSPATAWVRSAVGPPTTVGLPVGTVTYTYGDSSPLGPASTCPDGARDGPPGPPGRLTAIDLAGSPGGDRRWERCYDLDGRSLRTTLLEAAGGTATLDYAYQANLPSSVTWSLDGAALGKVSFAFDDFFRVASVRVDDQPATTYQYAPDGKLTAVGDLTIAYDPVTRLPASSTFGTVTTTVDGSTPFGQPTQVTAAVLGAPLLRQAFTYDRLGRIETLAETSLLGAAPPPGASVRRFVYDLDGRLAAVEDAAGAVVEAYEYDLNGNRTSALSPASGGAPAYAGSGPGAVDGYDPQDRLTRYGDDLYTFDDNGALAAIDGPSGTRKFVYDAFGSLLVACIDWDASPCAADAALVVGGRKITYRVDPQGRRVAKFVNDEAVQAFVYQDGLNPVAEYRWDSGWALYATYAYAPGSVVPSTMRLASGASYRIVSDYRGSVRYVTDAATGSVAQVMEYDAYGRTATSTPELQPFGFAGGLRDPDTGFVRFGARDYDPVTGRWTSKDPIGFGGGDTNLYAYVGGDPVNWVDPAGLAGMLHTQDDFVTGAPPVALDLNITWQELVIAIALELLTGPLGPAIGRGLRGLRGLDDAVDAARCVSNGGPKFPGMDPTKVPDDFGWKGKPGSKPGSKEGNYHNPETGESLRPDLDHPNPIGPHWDYRDPSGKWWRIKPDGSMEPK